MKKILSILLILIVSSTFSQTTNTKAILKYLNEGQELYIKNKETCNIIELHIKEELIKLTIDSINIKYREGLIDNLEKIKEMNSKGEYADYTMLLMDIVQNIKLNNLNYEDEDIYIKKELELKLQKNKEENERLKRELEYQKELNKKVPKKKITTK